ncbi:MAG: hypothetical protein GC202_11965 [Alphaproteobacteria bacterium]|nr:hypothetical protein [Alphaproteobacteria bacterium]
MALLVFDFDGTLVDSNALKREAFRIVADGLPDASVHLDRLLKPPVKGDRAWLFAALAEAIGRPEMAATLLDRYETVTRTGIVGRLEDGWARSFLHLLGARGHRLYVSSATPPDALSAILVQSGLAPLLAGQFGGFGVKIANLERILAAEGTRDAIVIGDGADDAQSAAALGCRHIPVDDSANALFRRSPAEAVAWLESRLSPQA